MNREYRVRSVIMRWVIIYDRVHTIIVKTLEVSSLQVPSSRLVTVTRRKVSIIPRASTNPLHYRSAAVAPPVTLAANIPAHTDLTSSHIQILQLLLPNKRYSDFRIYFYDGSVPRSRIFHNVSRYYILQTVKCFVSQD